MANFPDLSPGTFGQPVSPRKQRRLAKLKACLRFARFAMGDPHFRPYYTAAARKPCLPFNMAFLDAYYAPAIPRIDITGYTGQPGDTLRIFATDNLMVYSVRVWIYDRHGLLLETGEAILPPDRKDWVYTVSAANRCIEETSIKVMAMDLPGNQTYKSVLV
ncbi:hypothetical protein KJS94_12400 [Flavihumibacter rivuli]|uniref:hypothetical protein n=1 Tax=Flavihumibacter rivuli TaxID=2838156 RepID=UPI001BDEB8DC|nr:hypothetical protein [Flavihumibacter rivuli]ULQ55443.1 hypothetical protein KJS94_12400 [Flavihumibacter rivuli]